MQVIEIHSKILCLNIKVLMDAGAPYIFPIQTSLTSSTAQCISERLANSLHLWNWTRKRGHGVGVVFCRSTLFLTWCLQTVNLTRIDMKCPSPSRSHTYTYPRSCYMGVVPSTLNFKILEISSVFVIDSDTFPSYFSHGIKTPLWKFNKRLRRPSFPLMSGEWH